REYSTWDTRLTKKGSWHYVYDDDGFLTEKYKGSSGWLGTKTNRWKYNWNAQGMLQTVTRPDGNKVHFTYDALGRRLTKTFKNTTTKWLWDGNTPLHEWKENQNGDILSKSSVNDDGIITWVFEENSFIPTAKLKNNKTFSILADHLGTPTSMYNEEGETTWVRSLDSNGKVREGDNSSCPFLFQGQYYDAEIELAYNRFRYYDPEDGRYISKDPIGLESGEYNFYAYVDDPNFWNDIHGLTKQYSRKEITDARASAKKKAIQRANKLRGNKKSPTVVTAVVHIDSGKTYMGQSGTRPSNVHKNLDNTLPKNSKEIWPVNNCGEVDAYNKALGDNPGSKISDFTEVSIDVDSGTIKKPCKNCRRWVP
ncbi:type IV secretion protein Rhs, partial [Tenacibaculum finnmarkense]|uniref:RHS repeat domain-containing protein n=1 Tax=Tenacibaculum finnmarkense TaxID=2781243 RepID=UPI0027387FC6